MRMFNNDWDLILQGEMDKPYFQALMERVDEEYRHCTVYPQGRYISGSSANIVPIDESRYFGTRPISRSWAGAGAELFRLARGYDSSIFTKYT